LPGGEAKSAGGEASPGQVALAKGPLEGFGKVGTPKTASERRGKGPRSIEQVLKALVDAYNARDLAGGHALFPSNGLIEKHLSCGPGENKFVKKIERQRKKFTRMVDRAREKGGSFRYLSFEQRKMEFFAKGKEEKGCKALSDITVLKVKVQVEETKPNGEVEKDDEGMRVIQFSKGDWYIARL
jgi:hypothetical protein